MSSKKQTVIQIISFTAMTGALGYSYFNSKKAAKVAGDRLLEMRLAKETALSTGNLSLLYSSMVFFYLYGSRSTYESLFEYFDNFNLFKPKLIAFDMSDAEYMKKFDDTVRSNDFRKKMKQAAMLVEDKNAEALSHIGTPDDLMYLLTFHHCYTGRCEIVFNDKPKDERKDVVTQELQKIKDRAPDGVKELMRIPKIARNHRDENIENITAAMVKKANTSQSVFEKPLAKSYMVVVPSSKVDVIKQEIIAQMNVTYDINMLDAADPSNTQEVEDAELKKQLTRYN